MRILHFSDTHLGYNDLDKVGANGVNLREQDFYNAFSHIIDQALEIRPELVIHSGDFFHRPSPPNRPMIFALKQLNRLQKANIPIVVIAGNHETPKTVFTSPILEAFNSIDGVYPIFNQKYETHDFGELVVHGLPHINDDQILLDEMDKVKPVKEKFNIILLHTSIGKNYIMEEFGEKLYPPSRMELLDQFDYVALGHWHNFQQVSKLQTAWYCGAPERMSETEIGKEKGFCLIELTKGKTVKPEFISIPSRNWYKIEIEKCKEKSLDGIENEIKDKAQQLDLQDCLLSLILKEIESLQSISLSNKMLRDWLPDPILVNIKRQFVASHEMDMQSQSGRESLNSLLKDFIHKEINDESRAKSLNEKAQYYFELFESGEYKNR